MTLTEKKFIENFLKYKANRKNRSFNNYSNYNLARLTEGLKNGGAPMYIVNGKLLNTQSAVHVLNKGHLLTNFGIYLNGINNVNNAKRAFNNASIGNMTKAAFNRNYGFNYSYYRNINKPSQLKFPPTRNYGKNPMKVKTRNGVEYTIGNTWLEFRGKRYPFATKANANKAWNIVFAPPPKPKAAPKPKPPFKPAGIAPPKPKAASKPKAAPKPKAASKPKKLVKRTTKKFAAARLA